MLTITTETRRFVLKENEEQSEKSLMKSFGNS